VHIYISPFSDSPQFISGSLVNQFLSKIYTRLAQIVLIFVTYQITEAARVQRASQFRSSSLLRKNFGSLSFWRNRNRGPLDHWLNRIKERVLSNASYVVSLSYVFPLEYNTFINLFEALLILIHSFADHVICVCFLVTPLPAFK